jgi:hypothetical protein
MQTVEEEGVFWLMNADSVQERRISKYKKEKACNTFFTEYVIVMCPMTCLDCEGQFRPLHWIARNCVVGEVGIGSTFQVVTNCQMMITYDIILRNPVT